MEVLNIDEWIHSQNEEFIIKKYDVNTCDILTVERCKDGVKFSLGDVVLANNRSLTCVINFFSSDRKHVQIKRHSMSWVTTINDMSK